MIVNLRGPSGSGKSFVGFELLKEFGPGVDVRKPYFRTKKDKLLGHVLSNGIALAGRYVMTSSTRIEGAGYSGGLDGWYPMDEVQALVEEFCNTNRSVFFEGLLASGTFQRWLDFSHKFPDRVAFVTLDTPLEVCFARIQARNGGRPINEYDVTKHRRQVLRAHDKFVAAGAHAELVSTDQAYARVRELLLA